MAQGDAQRQRVVEVERKDLIGIHGDTGKKTADVIRKAVGGVLFIDEAYSLADGRYGNDDCIEVLLTAMEEHKSDTVFIFAGYVEQMREFLMSNPGIQSRIGYTFHFEDYSAGVLRQMYADKMKKMGFEVAEDALERVQEIMVYFQDVKHFGNGRFVNHVIHQTISQRASRDFTKDYRQITAADIPTIKTLIETAPNSMQLYDPAEITPEQQRRTAIHEVGHAAAIMVLSIFTSDNDGRRQIVDGDGGREEQLCNVLSSIEGAGQVEVMLEYDSRSKVTGAIILAEGASSSIVRNNLTNGVATLYSIPVSSVIVFEKKYDENHS